jgi:surface antigen
MNSVPRIYTAVSALLLGMLLSPAASADPPRHAPAHGHRAKHGHHRSHDGGQHHRKRQVEDDDEPVWVEPRARPVRREYDDYGVKGGRCDSHTVAKVLGGAAGGALGGVVGSQVGQGSEAGTIVGAVAGTLLGVIVGEQIGRSMDPADRYCTGRVLDFTPDRNAVRWANPQSRVDYLLTPLRSYRVQGRDCRDFTTQMKYGGKRDLMSRTACRGEDGEWEVR